jgi:pimeloyl-ACP methyl ester carboxylesterase
MVTAPERIRGLAVISAPAPGLEPSAPLTAAWAAEEEALERGDLDAAVEAVLAAWLAPDAPVELRDLVAAMQRRAFELDPEGSMPQPQDPLEDHPELLRAVDIPAVVAVGEHDLLDFRWSAERLAQELPGAWHHVIPGAGHLPALETPDAFRALLGDFLAGLD